MSYKVKLDIFEGPFDLLVYLIERSGLSIYDVNISEITTQYTRYVRAMQRVNPETAAEFMVLAATLIQIKSRMLLPVNKLSPAAAEEEDPRDELARKIEEYKKIKYLADRLRINEFNGARIYAKPAEDISVYTDSPVENLELDMNQFIRSFKAFLERRRRIEDVKKRYQRIDREHMTMEIKSARMRTRIRQAGGLDFTELIDDISDTYDIVLTFVTMLEMLKAGMIKVSQDRIYGNIFIEHNENYHEEEPEDTGGVEKDIAEESVNGQ